MAGREPAPPSGGANPGDAQVPVGGEVAGIGEHPAVRRTPCRKCPLAGFSQLRYDELLQHVRPDVDGSLEKSNTLVPFMISVQRRPGPVITGLTRFFAVGVVVTGWSLVATTVVPYLSKTSAFD